MKHEAYSRAGRIFPHGALASSTFSTHEEPYVSIWYIPVDSARREVSMTEIFVGIVLLAWVIFVLFGTGAEEL